MARDARGMYSVAKSRVLLRSRKTNMAAIDLRVSKSTLFICSKKRGKTSVSLTASARSLMSAARASASTAALEDAEDPPLPADSSP